jgi:hypothetical protein
MSKSGGPSKGGFQKATPVPKGAMTTKPIQAGGHRSPALAPKVGLGAAATKPTGLGGAVKAMGKAVVGAKPGMSPKPGVTPKPGAKPTKPVLTPQQKQNQRIDAINQILPGVTFKKK